MGVLCSIRIGPSASQVCSSEHMSALLDVVEQLKKQNELLQNQLQAKEKPLPPSPEKATEAASRPVASPCRMVPFSSSGCPSPEEKNKANKEAMPALPASGSPAKVPPAVPPTTAPTANAPSNVPAARVNSSTHRKQYAKLVPCLNLL